MKTILKVVLKELKWKSFFTGTETYKSETQMKFHKKC